MPRKGKIKEKRWKKAYPVWEGLSACLVMGSVFKDKSRFLFSWLITNKYRPDII
jgi:hypothetical protein